jgi:hypothetical protein
VGQAGLEYAVTEPSGQAEHQAPLGRPRARSVRPHSHTDVAVAANRHEQERVPRCIVRAERSRSKEDDV